MASTSKTNAGPNEPAKTADLSFEAALQKLEAIVEAMEGTDLPLESLLSQYEQGIKLAEACQGKLAEAEVKIQQLERKPGGELKVSEFGGQKTA